jgi:hypothetical protein
MYGGMVELERVLTAYMFCIEFTKLVVSSSIERYRRVTRITCRSRQCRSAS